MVAVANMACTETTRPESVSHLDTVRLNMNKHSCEPI